MFKLLWVLVFVSCASVQKITLKSEEIKPYPEYAQTTFAKQVVDDIDLVEVIDARENKTQIGEALVGVYFDKKPVVMNTDSTIFFTDYFSRELKNRNIEINPGAENKMTIIINELWVSELIEKFKPERAKCIANVSFQIKKGNKELNLKFMNSIISKGDMGDATEKIPETLASCMNEIVEKFVTADKFYSFL